MASKLKLWQKQLEQMKDCASAAEIVSRHGEPHHKVPQQGFEIWHYPLGAESGTFYSIHVSVWPDQKMQAYLFMEPDTDVDVETARPWWKFWKDDDARD
jgi:hypothetical protein